MVTPLDNRENSEWIVNKLRNNIALNIVSDGSYHPSFDIGSSSWVITAEDSTRHKLKGKNIVPGDKVDQCSHRSELCGLIGAIQHINLL